MWQFYIGLLWNIFTEKKFELNDWAEINWKRKSEKWERKRLENSRPVDEKYSDAVVFAEWIGYTLLMLKSIFSECVKCGHHKKSKSFDFFLCIPISRKKIGLKTLSLSSHRRSTRTKKGLWRAVEPIVMKHNLLLFTIKWNGIRFENWRRNRNWIHNVFVFVLFFPSFENYLQFAYTIRKRKKIACGK